MCKRINKGKELKHAVEMSKIVKGAERHRQERIYTVNRNTRRGEKVKIEKLKSERAKHVKMQRIDIMEHDKFRFKECWLFV